MDLRSGCRLDLILEEVVDKPEQCGGHSQSSERRSGQLDAFWSVSSFRHRANPSAGSECQKCNRILRVYRCCVCRVSVESSTTGTEGSDVASLGARGGGDSYSKIASSPMDGRGEDDSCDGFKILICDVAELFDQRVCVCWWSCWLSLHRWMISKPAKSAQADWPIWFVSPKVPREVRYLGTSVPYLSEVETNSRS